MHNMYVIKARTHGCVRNDSETHSTGVTGLHSRLRRSCNPVTQSRAFHCHFAHTRAFSLYYKLLSRLMMLLQYFAVSTYCVYTDVYGFTFNIRDDVWVWDELYCVLSSIHHITDACSMNLLECETHTRTALGADQCTVPARPGKALSGQ